METTMITRINGVDIPAVVENGETYLPIKPICQAIGVADQKQREKIQSHPILSSVGTLRVSTGADGKAYEMFCLPLEFVYGWLFTINPGNVSEEAREKVMKYQLECYRVLYEHFTGAGKKAQELAKRESELISEKRGIAEDIGRKQEEIRDLKTKISSIDQSLAKITEERINPQPTLF